MRAIGIILAGGNNRHMKELTRKQAISALPVAGSYRSIDFPLSSMMHSGIKKVAVVTQFNAQSLTQYLSSSKWWDFGRKQGGLYVFTPTITPENKDWYRGTADALYQNLDFLKECHEPYVVIASGDGIYKLDYNRVLDQHIETKADITIVCREIAPGEDTARFGLVKTDESGRVTDFEEKPMVSDSRLISCGIYVIRRRQLIDMLEQCAEEERFDFVRDVIIRHKSYKHIQSFPMEGYWSNINSVQAYYQTNLDFLKPEVRQYFFREYPGILSRVDDNPPAKYNQGACVRNSLISSGCILNGQVENSVLFHKVFVGAGCVIRNSVVLGDVYIGDNSVIENCIIDSKGTIQAGSRFEGSFDHIKVI